MTDSVFSYNASNWSVTPEMKDAYRTNGYVLVRNILSQEEIKKIRLSVEKNKVLQERFHTRDDGSNRKAKVTLWIHPTTGITGVLATMQRVAGTMEQLMGGDELYHYHTKLIMKDARVGGSHVWHQDYGYWYDNYCLFPEMGSVFIPIDDCTRENGCLQVLKGSHHIGRLEHGLTGEQRSADPERVEQAKRHLEHLYLEMKAGDILYFHCNLLHASEANSSEYRRWVFVVAFNKRKNDPYKDHHMPRYTPMIKMPNSALLECDDEENLDDRRFMKLNDSHYIKKRLQ